MPTANSSDRCTVLFVLNGHSDVLNQCCEMLQNEGVGVESVSDVYAAIARLAQGRPLRYVVVDARMLDDCEKRFLDLAPRYFPAVHVFVPLLEGTPDCIAALDGDFVAMPPADLIDSIIGRRSSGASSRDDPDVVELSEDEEVFSRSLPPSTADDAIHSLDERVHTQDRDISASFESIIAGKTKQANEADDSTQIPDALDAPGGIEFHESIEPMDAIEIPDAIETPDSRHAAFQSTADSQPLSTDGGVQASLDGPSLHEAVRQRMSNAQPQSIRRKPPQTGPIPPAASPPNPPSQGNTESSKEEQSPPIRLIDEQNPIPSPEWDSASLTPEELDALLQEGEVDLESDVHDQLEGEGSAG